MSSSSKRHEHTSACDEQAPKSILYGEQSSLREFTLLCTLDEYEVITKELEEISREFSHNDKSSDHSSFEYYGKDFNSVEGQIVIHILVYSNGEYFTRVQEYLILTLRKSRKAKPLASQNSLQRRKVRQRPVGQSQNIKPIHTLKNIERPSAGVIVDFIFNPLLWIGIIIATAFIARYIFNVTPTNQQEVPSSFNESLE